MGILHLCNKCFEKKKQKELDRQNYIKRLILLEGKKVLFQKELQKYKKKVYNLYEINDINFYKKMIKGMVLDMSKNNENKICTICYDYYLDKKIAAASCGHCFHLECAKHLTTCPICRNPNPNFKELFF